MKWAPWSAISWCFDSQRCVSDRVIARWLFLRSLGLIYFSAFFSLIYQVRGLIGPHGILPVGEYLAAVAHSFGYTRYWFAPTVLWFSSGSHMLITLCWVGIVASLLLTLNLWPRGMLVVCFACFLSFVSAAEEFSGYQSDGMLLEAGFISFFFAPPGLFPGWAVSRSTCRASLFLLLWEWFRIYFESGVAKIASGDPQWRHLTAMDEYYQNGPLPTWIGWYVQQLPHWFHAATAGLTLAVELVLVWMIFLPRRWRIVCFFIVTPLQVGIILTANYTFLNYLVLVLGFLLLDDRFLLRFIPARWTKTLHRQESPPPDCNPNDAGPEPIVITTPARPILTLCKVGLAALVLSWIFYATVVPSLWIPLPTAPTEALDPFRIANRYGLFAVMTRGRYEIEFQGSDDGTTWVPYPFRYKPQHPAKPPGIYAPYQPRFDWNLWFASLGSWREYAIVPNTEVRLLSNDADVLALFAGNPFPHAPPRQVRAVIWQYWFTTRTEKRATGLWWRRRLLGLYAPTLEREPDGRIGVVDMPQPLSPRSD